MNYGIFNCELGFYIEITISIRNGSTSFHSFLLSQIVFTMDHLKLLRHIEHWNNRLIQSNCKCSIKLSVVTNVQDSCYECPGRVSLENLYGCEF